MFREQELQRRAARAKRLENELKLDAERLTPTEQKHNEEAITRIHESTLQREKEITPGYWLRLWRAVCGK